MTYIRPSYVALAILSGTLLAEPASAWTPMAAPSVRPSMPPIPPSIGASVNTTSSAATNATTSAIRANRDGIDAAREFTDVRNKVRAKNPKATDQQVNAAAIQVIKKRRQQELMEWKKKDNEETNRLRAEQKAKENFNPNADVYDQPGGLTKEEHDANNQRTLPGLPNGTQDP